MAVSPQLGMPPSGQDALSFFASFAQFIAHDMLTQLSLMLGHQGLALNQQGDLTSRFKGVEFDDEPMVTGHVVSDDNGETFRVVICRGLVVCMWEMAKLIAARTEITNQGKAIEAASISERKAASTFAALMSSFWKGDMNELIIDSGIKLSLRQTKWAFEIMNNVICFLVGHECSHIYYQLSKPGPVQCRDLEKKSLALVELSPFVFSQSADAREAIAKDWSEEFFSDSLGLELSNTGSNEELSDVCFGAEFALMASRAIEAYWTLALENTFVWHKTHPPLTYRLQMIRNKLSGIKTDGRACQEMFERYLSIAIRNRRKRWWQFWR